jgi:hypothetical protein
MFPLNISDFFISSFPPPPAQGTLTVNSLNYQQFHRMQKNSVFNEKATGAKKQRF